MYEKKERVNVMLEPSLIAQMQSAKTHTKCANDSQYIREAVKFYNSFISSKNSELYLMKELVPYLEKHFRSVEKRFSMALFRFAVEVDMLVHILAATLDIPISSLERLKKECIEEVKNLSGEIDFIKIVQQYEPNE